MNADCTILLVDDTPKIRPLVRGILSELECVILEAGSGETALETASTHSGRIDLLLTDLSMPGMNGLELASKLRQIRPGVKVLCMSGQMLPATPVEDVHFIEKPFLPDALLSKVQHLLK